jgi:hypothetical protein
MKAQILCYKIWLTTMQKNVKEKIWKVKLEMPKISHEEFCKSFLVMILMVYFEGYYEFLARNWLYIDPRIKN